MAITAGQNANASDFITKAEADATPSNDSGRVPQLGADGFLEGYFLRNALDFDFTLGEGASADDAMYLTDGTETDTLTQGSQDTNNAGAATDASTERMAQSFTLVSEYRVIKAVQIWGAKVGAPTGNLVVTLHAVDVNGKPTGAALATATVAYSAIATGAATYYTFTFASPYTAVNGTQYAFVINPGAGASGGNYFDVYFDSGGSAYAGGKIWLSTDSGSTWANSGGGITDGDDIKFIIDLLAVAGLAYKAKATALAYHKNFLGFLVATGTVGQTKTIKLGTIIPDLSGLTLGSTYYLSDTAGAISTTPGTKVFRLGIALSTTSLYMNIPRRKWATGYNTISDAGSSGTTQDVTVTLGFRPKIIRMTGYSVDTGGNTDFGVCSGSYLDGVYAYSYVNGDDGTPRSTAGSGNDYLLRLIAHASELWRITITSVTETGFTYRAYQVVDSPYELALNWEAEGE